MDYYSQTLAQIEGVDAEIAALREKRKLLAATAAAFAPKGAVIAPPIPTAQKSLTLEIDPGLRTGGLKDRVFTYLKQHGPKTVPELQTVLNVPHMPSVFRAVSQMKELKLVFIDDEKKVHVKE